MKPNDHLAGLELNHNRKHDGWELSEITDRSEINAGADENVAP